MSLWQKKKQGLHYISYLVFNVLSMYQTWHLRLLQRIELGFYPFLASKLKIMYKILYKHLIKQTCTWILTFWFSATCIKTSSSKPWPINLGSKTLKILRKVTYFVTFRSWIKRTLLKFNLILQRCMVFLRSPTLQICAGRYLHRSMKIWKLYSLNTSYLENIYKAMYWRLTKTLYNSCSCQEVGSKWK